MAFPEGGWVDRGQTTSCPYDRKLSLKVDESQLGQRLEDVEWKQEYYYIIIFPDRTWNFTSRKKRTSEHHSDWTLQEHSLPQAKQSNKSLSTGEAALR